MNKDQIDTVADKAWELANEPDTDFEVCVLLKDCAFTIKELQSRLESLENVKSSLIERMKDAHDISMDGEHSVARSVLLDAIDAAMQSAQERGE